MPQFHMACAVTKGAARYKSRQHIAEKHVEVELAVLEQTHSQRRGRQYLGNAGQVVDRFGSDRGRSAFIREVAQRILNLDLARSEERRVGKECRSRWSP